MKLKNPLKPGEKPRVFARSQIRKRVDLNAIAEEITHDTMLTDVEVMAVLRSLIHKINHHLSNGELVSLNDFGSFQYQISSSGAPSVKAFNKSYIKKVGLQFRPGKMLRPDLSKLKFEEVLPVKIKKEYITSYASGKK